MKTFPTLAEVDEADRIQLCRWWRFLPSPGESAIGTNEFHELLKSEGIIMDRITERFHEAGGFTPEISKRLGWGKTSI